MMKGLRTVLFVMYSFFKMYIYGGLSLLKQIMQTHIKEGNPKLYLNCFKTKTKRGRTGSQ